MGTAEHNNDAMNQICHKLLVNHCSWLHGICQLDYVRAFSVVLKLVMTPDIFPVTN
jgi:hypothetical protein